MDREIVDTVTGWESAPFSGGYEGLRGLADREFSGAVTAGAAWGFMLNGRLIAIREGSLSAFETADGTAYEAPDPALPLLYAMYGRGEKQAEYYSNEKPISDADATLSSGSFTGYIELSENVLSGDYYTVYYGGQSMSAAFVGNSRRLLTGDEAFERADDEVGIYTVYAADLDVIDIPEADDAEDDEPTADEPIDEKADQPSPDHSVTADPTAGQPSADDPTDASEPTDADGSTGESSGASDSVTPTPAGSTAGGRPTEGDSAEAANRSAAAGSESSASEPTADPPTESGASTPPRSESETVANGTGGSQAATAGAAAADSGDDVFSSEAEWRNTKTIPSLDPSSDSEADRSESTTRSGSAGRQQSASGSQLSRAQLKKRLKRAEKVMDKAEEKHESLIEERDAAIAERDAAREELESVREELSAARAEVDRLEAKLQSADTGSGGSAAGGSDAAAGRSMSTTEALDGTNLLVRYASKGEATLEDAAAGEATQADVRSNVRIEPHTTFDSEGVSVDGTPFEAFLDDRIELAFVRWLVEEFLFDIQETGNRNDLSGIYETIPAINRAELRGNVELGTDEEGDTLSAAFDLVVRDKRDEPLFVAEFNESKQPVGGGMIESLVRDGSEIVGRTDSFAAAFGVTTSYYKGAALDAAANATGGGFLSASRGKSFVYISRKQGFHLCLVERLGDTFDLHVPEL